MFFEYFEDLRGRPVEARKRFAFVFTFVVTGCIIFIYGLSIFFTKIATKPSENDFVKDKKETTLDRFNDSNKFLENPNVNGTKKENWRNDFDSIYSDDLETATTSTLLENAERQKTSEPVNATETDIVLYPVSF